MSARPTRLVALALLVAALGGSAALAFAQQPPVPGGTVPSVLSLSLGEPSPFTRQGETLFTATIRAEVTATVSPTKLSLDDEETLVLWRRPLVGEVAKIRLRRSASDVRALRGNRKPLFVTLTAGGP